MPIAGFWEAAREMVRRVPAGRVANYGQIAAYLGYPRHARMIGWVLHDLPNGSDVPWHRIINAAGRISTSCETHSADLQRMLLEEEGIEFDPNGYVDLKRFRWEGPEEFPLVEGGTR